MKASLSYFAPVLNSAPTVVANYDALPEPTTVANKFYWAENEQGSFWLPGSLGGTFYNAGMYYSNGVSWSYMKSPAQATQAQVDAGTNNDRFVTSETLKNSSQWTTKENTSNKKTTIAGNETSTTFFGVIKAWIDWFKDDLASQIPAKATANVDNDRLVVFDSADGNKTKYRTWAQLKSTLFLSNVTSDVQAQLNNRKRYYILDNAIATNNFGLTSEVVLKSYSFAANEILNNNGLNVNIFWDKTNSVNSGSPTVRLKFNTVNDFSSATEIASWVHGGNFIRGSIPDRRFAIISNQLYRLQNINSVSDSGTIQIVAFTPISFNTGAPLFFWISIQNTAAADVTNIYQVQFSN